MHVSSYAGTCAIKIGAWVLEAYAAPASILTFFDDLHLTGLSSTDELLPPLMHPEPELTPGSTNEVFWSDVNDPDADQYLVQCASDSGFSNLVAESGWQTALSWVFDGLTYDQTYWYWARARRVPGGTLDVLWSDDFEDGNMDGWTLNDYPGFYTAEVTDATAAAATSYSLHLTGGCCMGPGLYAYPPDSHPEDISFCIRSGSESTSDCGVRLGAMAFFSTWGDGTMGLLFQGDHTTYSMPCSALTWYNICFQIDWTEQTYDLLVNDECVFSDVPFYGSATDIGVVYLWNPSSSGEAWYDEFVFSSGQSVSDWSEAVSSTQLGRPTAAPTMDPEPEYTRGTINWVSWSSVPTADAYYPEWDTDPNFGSPDGSNWYSYTSSSAHGLTDGATYYYRVKARNIAGEGPWSNVVWSTQDATRPTSQADPLPALTTEEQVTITWTASDAVSGVDYVETWASRNGGQFEERGSSSTGSITLTVASGSYQFYTIAVDRAGNREAAPDTPDAQIAVDHSAPDTCAGPLEERYDTPVIEVPFTATDDASGVVSVQLYYQRRPFGGSWGMNWIYGTYGPADSPVVFDSATTGGDGFYEFATVGTDAVGHREGLQYDCRTMIVTSSLVAPVLQPEPALTPGTSNEISWTDPNDPDAEEYLAECAEDEGFGSIAADSGWQTAKSHEFVDLALGETYYYRAKARQLLHQATTRMWIQTTQAAFETAHHTNTSTVNSPGDVTLEGGVDPYSETNGRCCMTWDSSNSVVGTFYHCTKQRELKAIEMWLDLPSASTLEFVVYDGTSQSGTYTKILQTSGAADAGEGWKSSGSVSVQLVPGLYYFIAVGCEGEFAYREVYADAEVSWGEVVGQRHLPYPPPATQETYPVGGGYYQRLTVAGSGFATSGNVISGAHPNGLRLRGWGTLTYDATTPPATQLEVDVLGGYNGPELLHNVPSGTDLSEFDGVRGSLMVRARLSTSDPTVSPALHEWAITWYDSPQLHLASDWSDAVQSTQDSGSAPNVTGWAIAATHGGTVGELICPLTDGHIEPRTCCIDCLVVSFTEALDPATVGAGAIQIVGATNGDVSWMVDSATLEGDGSTMRITTSATLPDPDWYTITVLDTVCDLAATPLAGDRDIKICSLHGDANGNLTADVGDLLAVRAQIGSDVDRSTARYDVNCNGTIDVGDMLSARAHVGNSPPPEP